MAKQKCANCPVLAVAMTTENTTWHQDDLSIQTTHRPCDKPVINAVHVARCRDDCRHVGVAVLDAFCNLQQHTTASSSSSLLSSASPVTSLITFENNNSLITNLYSTQATILLYKI